MASRSSTKAQPDSSVRKFSPALSWHQLYVLSAAVLVLAAARVFYGYLRLQTEHVSLWFDPESLGAFADGLAQSHWSAPLDDVFIHFDFARATARGYPFSWVPGNGYSSGGTSLLYPFVLAFGYLLGFQGLLLFQWAALVACICTFAVLIGARRLFDGLPPWAALFAPPLFLCVGALDWTLFSGMEVALFLSLWAISLVLWIDLMNAIETDSATRFQALSLGLSCALLVASRPEASPLVGVFGLWAGWAWFRRGRRSAALWTVLLVGVPAALVVVAHMMVNKWLTGSSAAAGALAKLEMHHPYMTKDQVVSSWWFFLKYQFLRLSDYHFGSPILGVPGSGFLIWPLAFLSLAFEKTRRCGTLLLLSVLLWFCLVALNGQVRWQNERYSMPAVAWLLLAAALGLAASFAWAIEKGRSKGVRSLVLAALGATIVLFFVGQQPRFNSQVWFFGRASRNILEQHVRAGTALRETTPPLHRIMLSDAGALPYASDLAAFDLIGLGGYGRLPIAEASRQGVGAAVELLEHMPLSQLPDVMALYPSWWGDFVLWFGRYVDEFPVRGNVICGGASMVIYAPRWAPILHSGKPLYFADDEYLIDSMDVADLLSERAHGTGWDRESQGYVSMKLLPDARDLRVDLWDAGRLLAHQMRLSFSLASPQKKSAELLVRLAPPQKGALEITINGQTPSILEVTPSDHWQELRLPVSGLSSDNQVTIKSLEGDLVVYHVFLVGRSDPKVQTMQHESR